MVKLGLESFRNRHIVFLQGPVGPFFKNLMVDFKNAAATVHQINFNGGDQFFNSVESIDFAGTFEEWPAFFLDFINKYWIDTVILFGDCRAYHQIAHSIAHQKGLQIGVFEEGYVRPDYITFEAFGVNGCSQLPREREFYDRLESVEFEIEKETPVGRTFWNAALWAILYYFFSAIYYQKFCRYKHHRPLNPFELLFWFRSFYRKWIYKVGESGIEKELLTQYSKSYYLVPLQISTDSQVIQHSDFDSVTKFIESVISSFAQHAPVDTLLVFKHHPLDRGYHNYSHLIKRLSNRNQLQGRVKYLHDQHLPTLLEEARGVVLINSTVGLSAIHHHAPLKVCGKAIYDFEGLTYQGSLNTFWRDSEQFNCDYELYHRFRGYIVNTSQLNGNFYKPLKVSTLKSGIIW